MERSVLHGHLALRIRKELEGETLLGTKALVAILRIEADTHHDGIEALVFRQVALEVMRFHGAARGVVFWIKIEEYPLAAVLIEAYG